MIEHSTSTDIATWLPPFIVALVAAAVVFAIRQLYLKLSNGRFQSIEHEQKRHNHMTLWLIGLVGVIASAVMWFTAVATVIASIAGIRILSDPKRRK